MDTIAYEHLTLGPHAILPMLETRPLNDTADHLFYHKSRTV